MSDAGVATKGNRLTTDGAPTGCVLVLLTKGKVSVIDVSDGPLVAARSWQASERRDGKSWYAVSDGVRMHRLLMGARPGEIVDHRNGDGLDNRRHNLRVGNQSQNSVNRRTTPGKYMRGTCPKKGKWRAYVCIKGKQKYLGYYTTEIEAHLAYLKATKERFGDWVPDLPLPPRPKE